MSETMTGIAPTGTLLGSSEKFTISASDLHDLLTGTILATGKDSTLPTLTGIFLQAEAGYLTATATDRYRLVTGKVAVGCATPFQFLLFNKNAEEVIKACKPLVKRGYPRTVSVEHGTHEIIFKFPKSTFTFRGLDGTFPSYEHLLTKDDAPSERMAFNCSLLGSFDGIPTGEKGGRVPVIFTFHGNSSLVTFTVAHPVIAWRGGIMPMRYKD